MRILPELLKSVEFGGGGPSVFGAVMKIGLKMADDEFESRLVPVIIRLFSNPDRAMRVCLLDNLPLMADRIPQKDVNNKVWPAMVTGFTDTAPVVREQTVKAVLSVISKLSDRVVNGELLRFLAKTANDEQPGIRTNTTICLGKIAKNLGVGSRTKVLVAAFSRSLRDPFVHARNAALMALNATIDVFSDDECATKILPAICASLVDKEKLVRDQANKTLDTYLQRVRKYAASMAETALPPETGTTTAPARMGNQNDTSWAGWAISSFTNKVTAVRGDMQPAAVNGATSQTNSLPTSGRATPSLQGSAEKTASVSKPATSQARRPSPSPPADVENDDDALGAWGTMNDDIGDDDDGDDSFFDAPSDHHQKTSTTGPAVAFDDGGEPDFAGWLAAQSKAKAQKPLIKGVGKPSAGSTLNVRPAPTRSVSAGPFTGGRSATKEAATNTKASTTAPVKKKPPPPKPTEPDPNDDDWGEAWD